MGITNVGSRFLESDVYKRRPIETARSASDSRRDSELPEIRGFPNRERAIKEKEKKALKTVLDAHADAAKENEVKAEGQLSTEKAEEGPSLGQTRSNQRSNSQVMRRPRELTSPTSKVVAKEKASLVPKLPKSEIKTPTKPTASIPERNEEDEAGGEEEKVPDSKGDVPTKKSVKRTRETIGNMDAKLTESVRRKIHMAYQNISDLEVWKKKHRLPPETKVYIVMGGYPDLKNALDSRGWVENPDSNSVCFDLKWTLMSRDIEYDSLNDSQVVNHFEKNTAITTKVGLAKNLRNLIWFNNVDIDTFYPRCFDLADVYDHQDFLEEFKAVKAEALLKNFMIKWEQEQGRAALAKDENFLMQTRVALDVCGRRVKDLDEIIDDPRECECTLVSADEWRILSMDEVDAETLAKRRHEAWYKKLTKKFNGPKKKKKKSKKKKEKKNQEQPEEDEAKAEPEEEGEEEEPVEEKKEEDSLLELSKSVRETLEALKNKFPQYTINGTRNIWIAKPAALSRGRGIAMFGNLTELLDHVKGKESQWVAQKYIENPLIIRGRKFDIRQWVLVRDWNPLEVWFYAECYVRFGAEQYDPTKFGNKFAHLTNNSIVKYSEHFDTSEIEGNMWTCAEFAAFLKEMTGRDVFEEEIQPRMKQIVVWSLECVQDMVESRRNTVELYGYDFMVDDDLKPWLIEINSSPAMDYSTTVTERLVKLVMEDTAKVIVDYASARKKERRKIDTGLFEMIHRGSEVTEQVKTVGLDLFCEGKALTKKKGLVKPTNVELKLK
eukprot:TRINITY_DN6245_c0_g2_i2.p1 TRINITY_DN6245_c0_g2~~TRINITY_DN6245_c0_g2_i2.p1  ORF type:complete len:778 (-),score=219.61 TRINITY_DN6245_c0_g2_i2:841-3174(-)